MLYKIYLTLFFLTISGSAMAQEEFQIVGTLQDTLNKPVKSANVVLLDSTAKIQAYTISDKMGKFELNHSVSSGSSLNISHLAYRKIIKKIEPETSKNHLIRFDIEMIPRNNSLDDIILVATNKAVRDTVRLGLDDLNLQDTDNLKEILKKLPGFNLGDDGSIIYKGKSIQKILINKNSSFVNQNSLALENMKKRIIKDISVINNYQDEFELDFDETEESVLNIDTYDSYKNVLTGGLTAKYGYKNKYDLEAKGFLFSNTLNAFLTHKTNNIGKSAIKTDELKSLFGDNQSFSNYQLATIKNLFNSNENLDKDFYTSTNFTLRKQTQRLKFSGLLYFISPKRTQSQLRDVQDLDNNPLLNSSERTEMNTSSLFSAFNLAYKASKTSIINYSFKGNLMNSNNYQRVSNDLFSQGTFTKSNLIQANDDTHTSSILNEILAYKKLTPNLIWNLESSYFSENTDLFDDFNYQVNMEDQGQQLDMKYSQNVLTASTYFKYNYSTALVSNFTMNYENTQENLVAREINNLGRKIQDFSLKLSADGYDIFKYWRYSASLSWDAIKLQERATTENLNFFPASASVTYENNLNRIYFRFKHINEKNNLNSGITDIQPFNKIVMGDLSYPLRYSVSNKLQVSYHYNNIFDGKAFGTKFSYEENKDRLLNSFLSYSNGISTYHMFLAEHVKKITFGTSYSKTVSQLHFPIKIDVDVILSKDFYPLILEGLSTEGTNMKFIPSINFESLTDHLINFSIDSKLILGRDKIARSKYKTSFFHHAISMILKNEKWKGTLTLLNDYNKINDNKFTRSNINGSAAYTIGKFIISMDVRHIGEVLSFFKNQQYNSQFVIRDGIQTTIRNNESLKYAIFGLTYNF